MSELNGKINCGDLTYHCKNKVIRNVLMILIMQWVLLKDKGWEDAIRRSKKQK